MSHVTVIGAGIVGVSAAAWLQKAGFKVTIVDSEPVGHGASFGNAGNVTRHDPLAPWPESAANPAFERVGDEQETTPAPAAEKVNRPE